MGGDTIRYDDLPIERLRGVLFLMNFALYQGRNASSAVAMLL